VGWLAQKRLANGIKLNQAEATALLASQLHELVRTGMYSVSQLMSEGKKMLGRRHVQVLFFATRSILIPVLGPKQSA
jgi:urease